MAANPRVLLIFLDGVGIGVDDPAVNPFARAQIPTLLDLMGGVLPTLETPTSSGPHGSAFPLAATMGVSGTPQSGTGQAALLTGVNAAEIFGRHFGPWTPVVLRPVVEERSLLRQAVAAGRTVAFANAYPREWPGPKGGRRMAAPPLAARGAGLLTRHEEALEAGCAVSSEIVNDGWQKHLGHASLPSVTEEEAGANLGRIAGAHDLTLYAHYSTDTAGHKSDMAAGVAALERVDAFLRGLVTQRGRDLLILLASDHGNIEDVTAGHTLNPVLGVASGPGAPAARQLQDIRDVAPFISGLLGAE